METINSTLSEHSFGNLNSSHDPFAHIGLHHPEESNSTVSVSDSSVSSNTINRGSKNKQRGGKENKLNFQLSNLENAVPGANFHPVISDDIGNPFASILSPAPASNSSQGDRLCHSNSECGAKADCVQLTPNQPKRCWCVNDLQPPDPTTGECGARSTQGAGSVSGVNSHGVILHDNIRDIVSPADMNATSARMINETSSMLQLPDRGHSSSASLPEIIPSVVGSFILVVTLLAVCFIYRRRYLNKKLSMDRNMDLRPRNHDGAVLLDRIHNISKNPTYFCQSSSGNVGRLTY